MARWAFLVVVTAEHESTAREVHARMQDEAAKWSDVAVKPLHPAPPRWTQDDLPEPSY